MSLTPDEIEAERERFEAWYLSNFDGPMDWVQSTERYAHQWIHDMWSAWLAAIESERERVRKASGGQNREDDAGDQGV